MKEVLTGQYPKDIQVQQPLDSAIIGFCDQFTSKSTQAAYKGDLLGFFRFATRFEVSDLSQLTTDHIDKYLQYCKEQNLSEATVRRRIAVLSSFLRGIGIEELSRTARKHYRKKPEMRSLRPLSLEEEKKLQEVSQGNSRDAVFIAIALGTGANVTEILDLRADHIVETDGQVFVRFEGKRGRIVKLNPQLSSIVKKHKGDRPDDLPLFTTTRLAKKEIKPLSRQAIWRVLSEYGERVGRPDLNPRILRETFIMNVQIDNSRELGELLGVRGVGLWTILKQRRLAQQLPQSEVLLEASTE